VHAVTNLNESPLSILQFYTTAPYPCSYLPERMACSEVATPSHRIDTAVYAELVRAGFRRSGSFTYRPKCSYCTACVPIRVLTQQFRANRSQRRAAKLHANLVVRELALDFDAEHYALYLRYQSRRHPGGGMDLDNEEQYRHFLLQSHVRSSLLEFRDGADLRMVSVIDHLADGLSAVYTFFDPDLPGTSFGIYNILWQINHCQRLDLPYLYLGYWITESPKMSYKAQFQPTEGLTGMRWQALGNQT
jgi:arginyl-tRNA--protein-N-Asp/Glu arginylyltransferase